jgi:flavodoxin
MYTCIHASLKLLTYTTHLANAGVEALKAIVIYSSKGGNTRKVAEEIASELSCELARIDHNNSTSIEDLNSYDLVFVGTGIYFGTLNPDMEKYLKTINSKVTKRFAFFVTWGGAGKTDQAVINKLKTILKNKGQKVIEECFTCYGGRRFALSKRGHPNNEDIKAAKQWAKKQLISIIE